MTAAQVDFGAFDSRPSSDLTDLDLKLLTVILQRNVLYLNWEPAKSDENATAERWDGVSAVGRPAQHGSNFFGQHDNLKTDVVGCDPGQWRALQSNTICSLMMALELPENMPFALAPMADYISLIGGMLVILSAYQKIYAKHF